MTIDKLQKSDLPQVYKMAFEAWKDAYAGQSEALIEKICEFIVRKNYFDNEYTFKITEDGVIRVILFGCEKNEKNDAVKWMEQEAENFSESERVIVNNQVDYLVQSDELLATCFTEEDIKLALIISNKRGYGAVILDHFMKEAQGNGKEKMYLWTDSTCNHEYYPKRGFEEVLRIDNANANNVEEGFQTLIYSRKI